MTAVVVLAVLTGLGIVGVAYGLRGRRMSLDGVFETWERPLSGGPAGSSAVRSAAPLDVRLGAPIVDGVLRSRWSGHRWVARATSDMEITGTAPDAFVSRIVVLMGSSAVGPLMLWLLATMAGAAIPTAAAAVCVVVGVPAGAILPVAGLVRRATDRRRHFRVVIGSFVDLVVLSLAGGVGIDGALHTASQVSPDWAAQRIGRTLLAAREAGDAPWSALEALGRHLDVPELVELATTVQLAGTEGARMSASLTARSASLRRHEQADAESSANAMTERLFLPGALLLLGFLVFIGYPAFQRILGGF
jgi:tight adherence protein C